MNIQFFVAGDVEDFRVHSVTIYTIESYILFNSDFSAQSTKLNHLTSL
jgi:hypothetical protein